jgi:hypothetical protein
MMESLVLFDSVVNSRWFMRTSIVLFLNKVDLFRQKLGRSPLSKYFPDYSGGNDVNRAAKYLLWRFSQVNRAHLTIYPQYVLPVLGLVAWFLLGQWLTLACSTALLKRPIPPTSALSLVSSKKRSSKMPFEIPEYYELSVYRTRPSFAPFNLVIWLPAFLFITFYHPLSEFVTSLLRHTHTRNGAKRGSKKTKRIGFPQSNF